MMLSFTKKFLILIFLAGFIVIIFQAGIFIGRSEIICETCQPSNINFSLFWTAYQSLKEKFVSPGKITDQSVLYGAISGMAKSLDDPYTVFFKPKEAKEFEEELSGFFDGIGIEIGIKKGQLTVIAPLEGTPAQKAGLRPGDKIVKIGDKETSEMTTEEAVSLIRGQKGTQVSLTIFRQSWQKPKEFKITRDTIKIPSSKWELLVSTGEAGGKQNDIAYVHIYNFSQNLPVDFSRIAMEILNSPARKIILDLRNNPGGYLEISQDIAGWFLEKDKVVVIEDFGNGKEQKTYKTNGNASLAQYPTVILINEGTASASEILAGALKDNRGIVLIGEKSFGKGSVQEGIVLRDGSYLKITIANWLTPKGLSISEKGLEPDIKIGITDEDYEQEKDPQLDKAIEIIEEIE